MGKGSRKLNFRISESLYAEALETIERRNNWTTDEPWDLTKFVRIAIRDKIKKMARSRKPRGRKNQQSTVSKVEVIDQLADLFLDAAAAFDHSTGGA